MCFVHLQMPGRSLRIRGIVQLFRWRLHTCQPLRSQMRCVSPFPLRHSTRRRKLKIGSSTGPVVRDKRDPSPRRREWPACDHVREISFDPSRIQSQWPKRSLPKRELPRLDAHSRCGDASGQKCAAPGIEFRLQKELCESRVGLIRLTVIQTHLRIARQFKFAGAIAVIDQRHRAYLGICIRHDTNSTAGLDIAIPSTKLGAIGVKLGCAFISGLRQWLNANRPQAVVAEVTNVIELAPTVARGIFAPAGYIQVAPGAVACAGGRDHHAVRAVGEQRYRRLRSHFLFFRHRNYVIIASLDQLFYCFLPKNVCQSRNGSLPLPYYSRKTETRKRPSQLGVFTHYSTRSKLGASTDWVWDQIQYSSRA